MSKGRIAIVIILALIVAVVAGMLILRSKLDGLVARAIEDHGTRLTGTSVTVDEVVFELRQGRATISGLRVANPDGFSDRSAMELGRLVLDIDPGSLLDEPYVIEDLDIQEVSILYELDASARRNLDVIRDHLNATNPSPPPASDQQTPSPSLIIHRLHQSGGTVQADASALGLEPTGSDLPGFTLEELGMPDGQPAPAIGKELLQRLIESGIRAALNDELKGRLGDILEEQLGEDVGEAAEKALGDLLK